MGTFITRIELHNANSEDYTNLHTAMKKKGYKQTITGNNGTVYVLPTAEYYLEGAHSRETVFNAARDAASTIGKKFLDNNF